VCQGDEIMSREHGSATLLAIITMLLLGSLGTTLLMLSRTNLQIATSQRDGMAAQYIAEAGIQDAIAKLENEPTFLIETETKTHTITSKFLGSLPTTGSYTVQISPDSIGKNRNQRWITATGIVNQAKRQVIVKITRPSQLGNPFIISWND